MSRPKRPKKAPELVAETGDPDRRHLHIPADSEVRPGEEPYPGGHLRDGRVLQDDGEDLPPRWRGGDG